ncbi:MAG: fructosamine kinase family protein [Methylovulum sp.]|nr:fructosamine kinase family protein [Methylovulum sp.]
MFAWQAVSEQISLATGQAFSVVSAQQLAGGDINKAFRLQTDDKNYFVKLNQAGLVAMFAAEFAGLQALADTQAIRVVTPVIYGAVGDHAFLVLEYMDLGRFNPASARLFGRQLARVHQAVQPYFGWHLDNTIGSTPQLNSQCGDWPDFWRERRLGFQLKLAAKNGYCGKLQTAGERLCADMDLLFDNYRPQASLLHGDLWAGNAAVDGQGRPVIFDPACYYGDREADLAMTELFGGFSDDFYAAYQAVYPLDPGYRVRKTLYNLYHILNHLNLFGSGYLRQAEAMLATLRAELG